MDSVDTGILERALNDYFLSIPLNGFLLLKASLGGVGLR